MLKRREAFRTFATGAAARPSIGHRDTLYRPHPMPSADPMRTAVLVLAGAVLALAFAVALSTRWQAFGFAAGSGVRTVVIDTWTGGAVICTTIHGDTLREGRTACLPEARP